MPSKSFVILSLEAAVTHTFRSQLHGVLVRAFTFFFIRKVMLFLRVDVVVPQTTLNSFTLTQLASS